MKKLIVILSLVWVMCAAPALSSAGGFSWDTPFGTGSFSSDDITQSGSSEGSGVYGSTPFSWGFSWDVPSQAASADAVYGNDSYSFSATFADIFAALFGL